MRSTSTTMQHNSQNYVKHSLLMQDQCGAGRIVKFGLAFHLVNTWYQKHHLVLIVQTKKRFSWENANISWIEASGHTALHGNVGFLVTTSYHHLLLCSTHEHISPSVQVWGTWNPITATTMLFFLPSARTVWVLSKYKKHASVAGLPSVFSWPQTFPAALLWSFNNLNNHLEKHFSSICSHILTTLFKMSYNKGIISPQKVYPSK